MATVTDGINNLVVNCAEVQRGEKVLLINEQGSMDPSVADLVVEAVRAAGGNPTLVWADAPDGGPPGMGGDSISDELLRAIVSADKVIASYPLRDRALEPHLGSNPKVLVVHSMFRTADHFASEHACYPWGMANAIYERFERELFAEGRRFRLAGTGGTDVAGVIGPVSARARQLEDEKARFSRSFNRSAFIPVASLGCEGQAVIEFTAGFRRVPIDNPPTLVIEGNKITRVEGRPEAKRWVEEYAKLVDERLEQQGPEANKVDSWHGGLHPTAECTPGPRGMIGNASTEMMHFHVGPRGDHMQAQWGRVVLELDGERIIDNGKYVPEWDDPKLRETAYRYGLKHWK